MNDLAPNLSLDFAELSKNKSKDEHGRINYPFAFGYLRGQLDFALSLMNAEQMQKMQERYDGIQSK